MRTYKSSSDQLADRKMFSTNYLTACGNSKGVIEVNYISLGIPVITSVFIRLVESNQCRRITKLVRGKFESDIIRDIETYENLVEESMREAYGDIQEQHQFG